MLRRLEELEVQRICQQRRIANTGGSPRPPRFNTYNHYTVGVPADAPTLKDRCPRGSRRHHGAGHRDASSLEAAAVGSGLAEVSQHGVVEQAVVESELLAGLILLRRGDEATVGRLLSRLAAVVRDVAERHHHLVAVTALIAPAAGNEGVEAPHDVITGELELGRRPRLDLLLVPVVEVVEGPSHHHAQVVGVLAPGSAEQSLHLRLSEEHDVIVVGTKQLDVGEPERILSERPLVHNVENNHQVGVSLLLLQALEDVAGLALHCSLLIKSQITGEGNDGLASPHPLLEVDTLAPIADLDVQL
mmetsp:Transcript_60644/g.161953  ORF Transcript_60644/g.161953 Transcript_60644/m.161953 type:complete len:303 (+) Transcript_60644:765-1673(+)